jgi:hypothetical protein
MSSTLHRPTLFLDFDDVLCSNTPYGGLHVQRALARPTEAPPDLFERLFSPEAVGVLNRLIEEFSPGIVLTTSWLALLDRAHFVDLFSRCGLERISSNLHRYWDAPADRGASRLSAIEGWISLHHESEPILILDDVQSGESLVDSFFHECGWAVLCGVEGCLTMAHLEAARAALRLPYSRSEPWR